MEQKSYSIVSVFFITCGMKHNKSYTPPKIDGMDYINRILIIYHFIPFHRDPMRKLYKIAT